MDAKFVIEKLDKFIRGYGRSNLISKTKLTEFQYEIMDLIIAEDKKIKEKEEKEEKENAKKESNK